MWTRAFTRSAGGCVTVTLAFTDQGALATVPARAAAVYVIC
jgi:hypothetical protein